MTTTPRKNTRMPKRPAFSDHCTTDPFPFNDFSPTQVGLADAFTRGVDGKGKDVPHMLFIAGFGWRVYDPKTGIWVDRPVEYIQGMVTNYAQKLRVAAYKLEKEKLEKHALEHGVEEDKKHHLSERNASVLQFLSVTVRQHTTITKAVEALAAHYAFKHDTPADVFDADPTLLACADRTIDIHPVTGDVVARDHNPDFMLTRRIPFRWNQYAKCPTWEKGLEKMYLDPVTQEPDRETIRYIQKLVGYALTGSKREDKIIFFDGDGSNGKSEFIEALLGLFGANDCGMAAMTNADILLTSKDPETFLRCMADLAGCRLALADEMANKAVVCEAAFKQATVKRLKVTQKWKNMYSVNQLFTLFIFVNQVPTFKDLSHGTARRLVVIPHFACFEKKGSEKGAYHSPVIHKPEDTIDNYGKYIVEKEAQGILAWVIRGLQAYYREGLEPSPAILKRTRQVLGETAAGTPVEFAESLIVKEVGSHTPTKDMYKAYLTWFESEGNNPKFSLGKTNFGKALRKLGYEDDKKHIEGSKNRQWVWVDATLDEGQLDAMRKSKLLDVVRGQNARSNATN